MFAERRYGHWQLTKCKRSAPAETIALKRPPNQRSDPGDILLSRSPSSNAKREGPSTHLGETQFASFALISG
jgi:hypothetical protein